ncbi:MAG: Mpo1-like protein [Gammaproteobacteria bacterium]
MNPTSASSKPPGPFRSFAEFYPYYLGEHAHPLNRRLHVCGTVLAVGIAVGAIVLGRWSLLWWVPLAGYGFAWFGHFRIERNRPATFRHPLYSLAGDFVMAWQVLTRRLV